MWSNRNKLHDCIKQEDLACAAEQAHLFSEIARHACAKDLAQSCTEMVFVCQQGELGIAQNVFQRIVKNHEALELALQDFIQRTEPNQESEG